MNASVNTAKRGLANSADLWLRWEFAQCLYGDKAPCFYRVVAYEMRMEREYQCLRLEKKPSKNVEREIKFIHFLSIFYLFFTKTKSVTILKLARQKLV